MLLRQRGGRGSSPRRHRGRSSSRRRVPSERAPDFPWHTRWSCSGITTNASAVARGEARIPRRGGAAWRGSGRRGPSGRHPGRARCRHHVAPPLPRLVVRHRSVRRSAALARRRPSMGLAVVQPDGGPCVPGVVVTREFLEAYAAAGDAREAALAKASTFAWLIGARALACIAFVNLGRTLSPVCSADERHNRFRRRQSTRRESPCRSTTTPTTAATADARTVQCGIVGSGRRAGMGSVD